MKMLAVVSLVAAAAAALMGPAVAEAKLCVRIKAPTTASRGEALRVSVTTLEPTWESGRLVSVRPLATAVRLRLALVGPKGEYRTIVLRRIASRPSVARATIRLANFGT
jgi:hypothetical protein